MSILPSSTIKSIFSHDPDWGIALSQVEAAMERTKKHTAWIAGRVAIVGAPLLALALDVSASVPTHPAGQVQAGSHLIERVEQLRQAAKRDASLYPESASRLRLSQFYNWCKTCK